MMRSKWFWCLIAGGLLAGIASWSFLAPSVEKAPSYRPAVLERGNLKIIVMTTGTVQPQNRLEIKSPIGGRVEQTLVDEGDIVHKGQLLAWMSSTERAALLDAAQAKGSNELAYWEQLYKSTPLLAPLDGDIIARKIEPGQTVTASDILYVMSNRLIVQAQVDETDIGQIAKGQEVEFTLDAYPQDLISGQVDKISFEAKTVNNVTTYTVEVVPLQLPPFMRSGMTANLKVLTASAHDVCLVPSEAVQIDKTGANVLQSSPSNKGKIISTPVTTGLNDGKQTEILSGLKEGDVVLIKMASTLSSLNNKKNNPFLPFRRRGR